MSIKLDPVKELQTAVIRATVRNELHEPILGSALLTLDLTLYDQKTAAIINDRDHQTILGTVTRVNGGIINEEGLLDLRLDPADNTVINNLNEKHVLLIEWSWLDDGVYKYGAEELLMPVTHLDKVPQES